jgi:orotate phosphoribosyltransferase
MLTTGGSVRQEVQEIERTGGQVVAVVRIVDRLQAAREAFAPKYDERAIFTNHGFGIEPPAG